MSPLVPAMGGFRLWTGGEAQTRGEFRGQAVWIADRVSVSANTVEGFGTGDFGEDTELAQILDAIAGDVQRESASARDAVAAEYAAKIDHARKTLPRRQAAGVIRALRDAKSAALAHIAREATSEIARRRQAAILARGKNRHPVKRLIWGGPPEGPKPN
jgi:hypothetical protein